MADEAGGVSAADAEFAPAGFAAWQEAVPMIFIGRAVVDVAID